MATVPVPYDAVAFEKLTAVNLDNGVRDPLTWLLTDYPRVMTYSPGSLSCSSGVAKLITMNSELYDNDNMHSTVSNASRIVFNTPGLYNLNLQCHIATATFTGLDFSVVVNGAGAVGGGTLLKAWDFKSAAAGPGNLRANFDWPFLTPGDYIEMFVTQTNGGGSAVNTSPGTLSTFAQCKWIATS